MAAGVSVLSIGTEQLVCLRVLTIKRQLVCLRVLKNVVSAVLELIATCNATQLQLHHYNCAMQ